MPRTPPLRDAHAAAGARFTTFGGWEMPVHFGSIRAEHERVRTAVGAFDVSHMGQVAVSGPDALELLDRLTTNDAGRLDPGDAQYTMTTDEAGVILDDVLVYRAPADPGPLGDADFLVVPNAGHDAEATARFERFRDAWGLEATVDDRTESYAMFAVQGPDAPDRVASVAGDAVRDLPRFAATTAPVASVPCLVSNTGYTGERGFELVCPRADASAVWGALDCPPCGLGARDTLRIEMGYLLSGQDFDPETNPRTPFEAGVGFSVALDTEFLGRDALAAARDPPEAFTGVRLTERRGVPRHGHPIESTDGDPLGTVTSGTMSPTLDEPVALGYLPRELDPGDAVRVVVRERPVPAVVVDPPFLEGY